LWAPPVVIGLVNSPHFESIPFVLERAGRLRFRDVLNRVLYRCPGAAIPSFIPGGACIPERLAQCGERGMRGGSKPSQSNGGRSARNPESLRVSKNCHQRIERFRIVPQRADANCLQLPARTPEAAFSYRADVSAPTAVRRITDETRAVYAAAHARLISRRA
jgi:hypothetical protein